MLQRVDSGLRSMHRAGSTSRCRTAREGTEKSSFTSCSKRTRECHRAFAPFSPSTMGPSSSKRPTVERQISIQSFRIYSSFFLLSAWDSVMMGMWDGRKAPTNLFSPQTWVVCHWDFSFREHFLREFEILCLGPWSLLSKWETGFMNYLEIVTLLSWISFFLFATELFVLPPWPEKLERHGIMEDLAHGFHNPSIIDLKVGGSCCCGCLRGGRLAMYVY